LKELAEFFRGKGVGWIKWCRWVKTMGKIPRDEMKIDTQELWCMAEVARLGV
jgi:hypothetical protein